MHGPIDVVAVTERCEVDLATHTSPVVMDDFYDVNIDLQDDIR
jgi:hypothetical protein